MDYINLKINQIIIDPQTLPELNNSTYSDDDEDSDELESDIDYPVSENQKPIISLKAAKAAAVLPSPSSTPSPYNSDIDSTLEGRPLPRPIASSTYQKRTPKFNSRTDSLAAAKAAAVEDEERNNYLRKFSPIDDPASGPFDYFGLDPDVMAKAAARGLKLTPSTFSATSGKKTAKRKLGKVGEYSGEDEDEEDDDSGDDGDEDDDDEDDSTNEAEEDLGSMEEGVVAALKASQKGMGKGGKLAKNTLICFQNPLIWIHLFLHFQPKLTSEVENDPMKIVMMTKIALKTTSSHHRGHFLWRRWKMYG